MASSPAALCDPHQFQSGQSSGHGGGSPDPDNWLAALISGSDDAIVRKNLNGVIQAWNPGATRMFGYSADEVIGRSILVLIPDDRLAEESAILAQIRDGKSVGRFETKRRRKDGSLVDISLTISVIRDAAGVIVGASKIARDITERLMERERQQLLMDEMHHRVKNLFAVAGAIVTISARSSGGDSVLIDDIRARLVSLARAHELTIGERTGDTANRPAPSLRMLIARILDPYVGNGRVTVEGDDCYVGGNAVTYLSLLLHEMTTNAAKFGSLSVGNGRLDVHIARDGDLVRLIWRETGGPPPSIKGAVGFGTRLERSLTSALCARIERDWRRTGLVATIVIPGAILAA